MTLPLDQQNTLVPFIKALRAGHDHVAMRGITVVRAFGDLRTLEDTLRRTWVMARSPGAGEDEVIFERRVPLADARQVLADVLESPDLFKRPADAI